MRRAFVILLAATAGISGGLLWATWRNSVEGVTPGGRGQVLESGDADLDALREEMRSGDLQVCIGALQKIESLGQSAAALANDVVKCLLWAQESDMQGGTEKLCIELYPHAQAAMVSLGAPAVRPILEAVRRSPARHVGYPVFVTYETEMNWLYPQTGAAMLCEIGTPAVIPLADLLGDPHACDWAQQVLRYLALDLSIAPALEAIRAALDVSGPPNVVTAAIRAAWNLDDEAAVLLPELTELLKSADREVRLWALKLLAHLGPDASSALKQLEAMRGTLATGDAKMSEALEEAIRSVRRGRDD